MFSGNEGLRARIASLYPEIGRFGLDVSVEPDPGNEAVSVRFSGASGSGRTLVDSRDASDCLDRGECLHLGIQVGQFVHNYCDRTHACSI